MFENAFMKNNVLIFARNPYQDDHPDGSTRKLDYHSKNHFVESEIEEDIRFFESSVKKMFSIKRDANNDFDYIEIKKILRKNIEIIEKRDAENAKKLLAALKASKAK